MNKAIDVLNEGGIILYLTDTIWGIGCDATNVKAVRKIYDLKKRQTNHSMLLLLDNDVKLHRYVKEIPDVAWDIVDASEEPITIIYPQGKNLAENLLSEDGSIGIRIIKEKKLQRFLQRFKKPLVSTSANLNGMKTPRAFSEISKEIIDGVDYVLKNDSKSKNNKPSSIIKIGLNSDVKIIRK